MDPREHGRPLDARESRAFDDIVAAFGDPPSVLPPAAPPPVTAAATARAPGCSPLTWRQVMVVLAIAVVVAALTAVLPAPLNLWAPVVLFAAIALGSIVWGCRQEARRPR